MASLLELLPVKLAVLLLRSVMKLSVAQFCFIMASKSDIKQNMVMKFTTWIVTAAVASQIS